MNASEYLKGQGWRGTGFSLDQSNRGLSKPLLVSHRIDQSGLGTKKNDFSEQWWATAFDKSLKSFGSGTSTTSAPLTNPTFAKHSGLYSKFVRAETLQGSFNPPGDISSAAKGTTDNMHVLDVKGALPNGGPRLTTGPALGEIVIDIKDDAETGAVTPSKKRKRRRDDEDGSSLNNERSQTGQSTGFEDIARAPKQRWSKARKRSQQAQQEPATEGGIQQHADSLTGHHSGKSKKAKREDVLARRRAKRRVMARDTGLPNQARDAAERHEAETNEPSTELLPDREIPSADLIPKRSIMARRQKGEKIDLPGDKHDPDIVRSKLIRAIETGPKDLLKSLLREAFPGPKTGKGNAAVKARKAAKKDARRWVKIRANPHLFHPDGTPITPQERGITESDINAEVEAHNEHKRQKREERLPKKQSEEEQPSRETWVEETASEG